MPCTLDGKPAVCERCNSTFGRLMEWSEVRAADGSYLLLHYTQADAVLASGGAFAGGKE